MKSFLEKSKKALVLLLTGAMIATSVPSNALAATVADDADEIIFEDVQDVVENDAAALEDEVANLGEVIVNDEVEVEPEALSENDSVEPDNVDPDSNVRIMEIDLSKVNLDSLQYGLRIYTDTDGTAVAKATTDLTPGTPTAYADVDWYIYEVDSTYIGSGTYQFDNSGRNDGLLAAFDTAYALYVASGADTRAEKAADVATAFADLAATFKATPTYLTGVTVDNSGSSFTFNSSYLQETGTKYYALVAVDQANNNNMAVSELITVNVDSVYTNDDAALDETVATPKAYATGQVVEWDPGDLTASTDDITVVGKDSSTADVTEQAYGLGVMDFGAIPMGYNGYNPASEVPDNADASTYVVAKSFELKVNSTNKDKYAATNPIAGVTYSFTDSLVGGTTVDYFEVVEPATSFHGGSNLKVKVRPSTTLEAENGAKDYTAYLHIDSEQAFDDEIVVKVVMTVEDNIVYTVTEGTGEDAEEIEKKWLEFALTANEVDFDTSAIPYYTRSGSSPNYTYAPATGMSLDQNYYLLAYDLGSRAVGEEFNDIEIAAKGGVTRLNINLDDGTLPSGVTSNLTESGTNAKMTLSGPMKQDATKQIFSVVATDVATTPNEAIAWFVLDVDDVDETGLTVTLGEDELEYGSTGITTDDNYYTWRASLNDTVDSAKRVLKIKNNTNVDLKIEDVALKNSADSSAATDFTFDPAILNKTIKAGETLEVTVAYNGDAKGSAKANKVNVLTFGGTMLATTKVVLDFERYGSSFTISKPAVNYESIDTAYNGVAYEGYQFEATQEENISAIWSIADPAVTADVNAYVTSLSGGYDAEMDFINDTTGTSGTAEDECKAAVKVAYTSGSDLKSEYGLSIDNDGKITGTPKKTGRVLLLVKATYVSGATTQSVYRSVELPIVKPTVYAGLEVAYDGTSVKKSDSSGVVNLGTLKQTDKGTSARIDITNLTGTDIVNKDANGDWTTTGVTATIDALTGPDGSDTEGADVLAQVAQYFALDFGGADYTTNGLAVDKGGSNYFTIKTTDPNANVGGVYTTGLIPGKYVATITVGIVGDDETVLDDDTKITFTAELKVKAAPVINESAVTGTIFTVGDDVVAGDNVKFTITDSETTPRQFRWSWDNTAGATDAKDINASGLIIAANGLITTEAAGPLVAGTYKVTVFATSTTGEEEVVSKDIEFTINGAVTITLDANDSAGTSVGGLASKVYVLPAVVVPGTDTSSVQVTLKNDSTTLNATNIEVKIADAEDDGADIDYTGSDSILGVTKTNAATETPAKSIAIASVAKNTTTSFFVSSKGTPTEGEYKVKVTVTGDNIVESSFWVYLPVVKKLSITEFATKQTAIVGDLTHIAISAEGADKTQALTWTEVDADGNNITNDADTTGQTAPRYISKSQINAAGKTSTSGPVATKLYLSNAAAAKGAATVVTHGDDMLSAAGTIARTGSHPAVGNTVFINAASAGLSSSTTYTADDEIDGFDEEAPTTMGEYTIILNAKAATANFVSTGHTDTGSYVNTANVFPEQEDDMTFTLEVKPSNKVKVAVDITEETTPGANDGVYHLPKTSSNKYTTATEAADAPTEYDITKGVQGIKVGKKFDSVSGYVYKAQAKGDAPVPLYVNLYSESTVALEGTLSLTSENFVVDNDGGIPTPITEDATTHVKTITINDAATNGGYTAFQITPKANLDKGTYEDTLTISGDNMDSVTFTLKYVVEDPTYLADVRYFSDLTVSSSPADEKAAYAIGDTEVIATDNNVTGTLNLTPSKKDNAVTTKDVVFVNNTGNSDLTSVKVYEAVQNADGTFSRLGDSSKLTLAIDGVDLTTSGATVMTGSVLTTADKGDNFFYIAPNATVQAVAGVYDTYIMIQFASGGSNVTNVGIPVHFVVFDDVATLTTEPTSSALTLAKATEGYLNTAVTGGEITLTNTGTVDSTKPEASSLFNLSATLSGTDASKFTFAYDDDDTNFSLSGSTLTIKELKAGNQTAQFKVIPDPGLEYGEYTANLTIAGENLSKSVIKTVNFEVEENSEFTVNVFSDNFTPTGVGQKTAVRLFNTLYTGATAANSYVVATGETGDGSSQRTITLDLSGADATKMIKVIFTGSGDVDAANEVDDATIVSDSALDINIASKSITLSETEATRAKGGASGTNKFFSTLSFNLYSTVTFIADASEEVYIVETKDALEKDNEYVAVVGDYTKANAETGDPETITGWTSAVPTAPTTNVGATLTIGGYTRNMATGEAIIAVVPNGSSAASVFNGGNLPTAKHTGDSFEEWVAGSTRVTGTTKVLKDVEYTPLWHEHKYAASVAESVTGQVEWTWTGSETAGYTDASVTIYCIDNNCPDHANKGKQTFNTASEGLAVSLVKTNKVADCINGDRVAYTATLNMGDGRVYTSEKSTNEGEPLGHQYKPTVDWTKDAEGNYTGDAEIYLECVRTTCTTETDGHRVPATGTFKVTATKDETTNPATCTTAGTIIYTIETFTEGGKTYTVATDFEAYKDDFKLVVPVPAKGHNKDNFDVTYTFDADGKPITAAVYCLDDTPEKFKVYEGPVTAVLNANNNYDVSFKGVDGVDYTIEYIAHEHVWDTTNIVWNYTITGGVVAATTATFTCNPVGAASHTKDQPVTVDGPVADGSFNVYTLKVTSPAPDNKEYTKTVTVDASGKEVTGEAAKWTAAFDASGFNFANGAGTINVTLTGDNGAVDKQIATVTSKANAKGIITYTAEVTDRKGKTQKNTWTYDPATGTTTDKGTSSSGDYNYEDDAEEDGTFTASFEGDETEYVYTGAAIKPNVIVNNGEKTLVNGVDYTLKYANNTNVGKATVTVKGKGLYTSTLDLDFAITKASIADAAIGNLAYKTGTASDKIKPTANYKGKALTFGKDFTIKEMGDLDSTTNTQTMTIAGAGTNFDSESTQDVTITYSAKPAKINATINVAKTYDYTGEEVLSMDDLRDLVTVSGLAEGANFYVTAGDLVNAGTCKIAVTADGFKGSKTASFKILPAKSATMTVTNADDLTSTGTKFKVAGATPYVAVNAKISDSIDYDLVLGKDYKVTYSKNKTAGTGTAKITFLNNYKGATAITQTFKINKANLDDATVSVADFVKGKNAKSKTYMAAPDKKLFVSIDGMQIKKSEYAVTYKQGETTLTGKEDITFEDGVATITVEIAPSTNAKSLEAGTTPLTGEYKVFETAKGTDVSKGKVTVVSGGKTAKIGYTGTAITFAQDDTERQGDLSLKIGKTVVSAKDIEEHFDITYVNNVNKGKATVILTAKDGDDTYTGSATGTFTIGAHVFNKAKDIKD